MQSILNIKYYQGEELTSPPVYEVYKNHYIDIHSLLFLSHRCLLHKYDSHHRDISHIDNILYCRTSTLQLT